MSTYDRKVLAFTFHKICARSWWVLVPVLSIAFYLQAAHNRSAAWNDLSSRTQQMEMEKLLASQHHEDLMIRLQSESDPAWIEMTLMKELGVVPEGWVKVHFQK